MTLFFEWLAPWAGERIGDVQHSPQIEALWTDEQLAEIGLYRPEPGEDPPEGYQVASSAPQWIDGVMRYVNVFEPIPYERRRVDKWLIVNRIAAEGKGAEAKALLDAPGNEVAFFQWIAPIQSVYFDDEATVAMIEYLGLDPEKIMAPP